MKSENNLLNHLERIHKETRTTVEIKCVQCNLIFPANAALETHISDVHTRKTSVKCDHCDSSFENNEMLEAHFSCVHRERTTRPQRKPMTSNEDRGKRKRSLSLLRHKGKRRFL